MVTLKSDISVSGGKLYYLAGPLTISVSMTTSLSWPLTIRFFYFSCVFFKFEKHRWERDSRRQRTELDGSAQLSLTITEISHFYGGLALFKHSYHLQLVVPLWSTSSRLGVRQYGCQYNEQNRFQIISYQLHVRYKLYMVPYCQQAHILLAPTFLPFSVQEILVSCQADAMANKMPTLPSPACMFKCLQTMQ